MVGDFDNCKINFVQNVRSLGGLEASNSLTGVGSELGTFFMLSRVASHLKMKYCYLKTGCQKEPEHRMLGPLINFCKIRFLFEHPFYEKH